MSIVMPFTPLSTVSAQKNLDAFITYGRKEVFKFGADLDFDANTWDITRYCFAQGRRGGRRDKVNLIFTHRLNADSKPLSPYILDFAKAYIRSEVAHLSIAVIRRALDAFRFLDLAMIELQIPSICDCDAAVFNKAMALLILNTTPTTADAVGPRLGQIARFLEDQLLSVYPLGTWKYIKQIPSTFGRIGKEFEKRKTSKLPSQEALDCLAQAFHLAKEPKDKLITSVAAILCSAPERINEVLCLANNCEVEQIGDNGTRYLCLRWAGSKGYEDHIKFILPGMANIVREALRRIRDITDMARDMAVWYEQNPTAIYLPKDFEHLRNNEYIDYEDIARLLGYANSGDTKNLRGTVVKWVKKHNLPITKVVRHKGHIPAFVLRFEDFEKAVLYQLPLEFPLIEAKRGLKYSEALFVIPKDLFGCSTSASLCMVEALQYHHIFCGLGQNAKTGSVSIFQRVGLDTENSICIKSNQFRHWLNTLAQGANLSQVDIAKWSGRANISQNAAYDHVTSEEIVTKIRAAVGDHAKAIGPLAEIPTNLPVSRAEFAQLTVPTAHITIYGFCIHDFTTTPCEMFRKCLDCREHVCIKGILGKVEKVQQSLEMAKAYLSQALKAVDEEVYGAEDWVSVHEESVNRLEQLLSILTDPTIEDGAVIQLRASGTYSLSEGAIRDHETMTGVTTISNTEPKEVL